MRPYGVTSCLYRRRRLILTISSIRRPITTTTLATLMQMIAHIGSVVGYNSRCATAAVVDQCHRGRGDRICIQSGNTDSVLRWAFGHLEVGFKHRLGCMCPISYTTLRACIVETDCEVRKVFLYCRWQRAHDFGEHGHIVQTDASWVPCLVAVAAAVGSHSFTTRQVTSSVSKVPTATSPDRSRNRSTLLLASFPVLGGSCVWPH